MVAQLVKKYTAAQKADGVKIIGQDDALKSLRAFMQSLEVSQETL